VLTGNEKYVARIQGMSLQELLAEILENAEYLTDSYYRQFGQAMQKRGAALLQERATVKAFCSLVSEVPCCSCCNGDEEYADIVWQAIKLAGLGAEEMTEIHRATDERFRSAVTYNDFPWREALPKEEGEVDLVECAYCGQDVPGLAWGKKLPAPDDDDAWLERAEGHAEGCEWIVTRAFRREATR
jgi:hypothetical protein